MTSVLASPAGATPRWATVPEPDGAGPLITRSWQRSIQLHGLDRAQNRPRVLAPSALREHRQALEPLLSLARSGLEALFQQICGAGYIVLLTDAEGVAVDFIPSPSIELEARRAGLAMGACWTEGEEGACAVGIALAEKLPITVHRTEHFLAANSELTCSAVPIFDTDGRTLAILDASALDSPQDRQSQHLVLKMLQATARSIEDAYFLRQFEQQVVLRTGCRREFLEVCTDGLVALEEDGTILAANQRFVRSLDLSTETVRGTHLADIFDVTRDELLSALNRSAGEPFGWRVRRTTHLHFAQVRPPRQGVSRRAASNGSRASMAPESPQRADSQRQELEVLGGSDPRMQTNVKRARRILDKEIAVLLLGESGTGKELFARAMHACSGRACQPFIAINCAAIPETLLESELFGYSAGAFTGARAKGVRGKIIQAHGGTLFLDEIGDMPLAMQTRLLRVLAEREVTPLGAEHAVPVDVQVICATHQALEDLVASERFRLDLYYRINGLSLTLPPLREREDRHQLIEGIFAEEARRAVRPALQLSVDALEMLDKQRWPGNLRQLRHALQLAVALCDGNVIRPEHLPDELDRRQAGEPEGCWGAASAQGANDSNGPQVLVKALQGCQWNITIAARKLGISRSTLYRQMSRFNIIEPNRRELR
ncbi:MAG: sigma-54-dependent Fis family transcriptional regulator [Proteobacteria bacterium]|nr:sigma-54-dependent Fis family transcriptional regulator [Pseudomonadota bacterium]